MKAVSQECIRSVRETLNGWQQCSNPLLKLLGGMNASMSRPVPQLRADASCVQDVLLYVFFKWYKEKVTRISLGLLDWVGQDLAYLPHLFRKGFWWLKLPHELLLLWGMPCLQPLRTTIGCWEQKQLHCFIPFVVDMLRSWWVRGWCCVAIVPILKLLPGHQGFGVDSDLFKIRSRDEMKVYRSR